MIRVALDLAAVSGIAVVNAFSSNSAAQFIAAILFYFSMRWFEYWRKTRKNGN
jgi:hypothetical protein